jgi:methionine synthase II (cobalamin-independent)
MASGASVHLVGSFPTRPVKEVFDMAGQALKGFAPRLPDGEPQGWINFSNDAFYSAANVELLPDKNPRLTPPWAKTEALKAVLLQPEIVKKAMGPAFKIKPGFTAADVRFAPTGYVELAKNSYQAFRQARDEGKIAPGTKFQQSMPTPFIMLWSFVPEDGRALLNAFERHLFAEVRAICDAIPHQDLAFQWDVVEVSRIEGGNPGASLEEHADMIARACEAVPDGVDLGVHLCYGNAGGRHQIQPKDASVMVDYANAFLPKLTRPLRWLHMPVPIDRDDDAYFAPLDRLNLPSGTAFYLGLVHPSDGLAGAERRVAAAKKHIRGFGVATECGLRFFPDEEIPNILQLHCDTALIAAE